MKLGNLPTSSSLTPFMNIDGGGEGNVPPYPSYSEDYLKPIDETSSMQHLLDSWQRDIWQRELASLLIYAPSLQGSGISEKSWFGVVLPLPGGDKGNQATQQPSHDIVSPEFRKYLSNLGPDVDAVAPQVVSVTNRFLDSLYRETLRQIPNPQAWMSEHGYLSLLWERGEEQFSVELYQDNQMDWFWRDKSTEDILAGEAVSCSPIPIGFVEKFVAAFGQYSTR